MIIMPVEQGDIDGGVAQRPRCVEAAETGPHNHHLRLGRTALGAIGRAAVICCICQVSLHPLATRETTPSAICQTLSTQPWGELSENPVASGGKGRPENFRPSTGAYPAIN